MIINNENLKLLNEIANDPFKRFAAISKFTTALQILSLPKEFFEQLILAERENKAWDGSVEEQVKEMADKLGVSGDVMDFCSTNRDCGLDMMEIILKIQPIIAEEMEKVRAKYPGLVKSAEEEGLKNMKKRGL